MNRGPTARVNQGTRGGASLCTVHGFLMPLNLRRILPQVSHRFPIYNREGFFSFGRANRGLIYRLELRALGDFPWSRWNASKFMTGPTHCGLYWVEPCETVGVPTAPFSSRVIQSLESSEAVESRSLKYLGGKSVLIHLK